MFGSMKSKSAIGIIAILLLTTLTPSAVAGKPGTIPTLTGTLCKSFAGVWNAKVKTCFISGNSASYVSFIIDSKSQLSIDPSGDFTNYYEITNNGSITNYGSFHTSNSIINIGNIVNMANFYSNYHITNNGFIWQNGNWDGCVYNFNSFDGNLTLC